MTFTGLDRLVKEEFEVLRGKRIGVVCNQATVDREFVHLLDRMLPYHRRGEFEIVAAFGPQHGIWGHTQDNMIEWEGYEDPATGLHFFSLYGEHREPTAAMLAGVELLVFDVQDVGSRYYTFMWTLFLCMKACLALGIPVLVLDRPNPIGGVLTEGTVLEDGFESFVGLKPLPMRHGLTMGELGRHFHQCYFPGLDYQVYQMVNWSRAMDWDETGLPWVPPSPNMPTTGTALVYPGMCLIEGTKLSEGRGTTRPFESFGVPGIDGRKLCDLLAQASLPGVIFRPIVFQPTFQKHAQHVCEGAFIHVVNKRTFEPVLTAVAIIRAIRMEWPQAFAWQYPPYEYEYIKLPIDILHGNTWLREAIESGCELGAIRERMADECLDFEPRRRNALIYSMV